MLERYHHARLRSCLPESSPKFIVSRMRRKFGSLKVWRAELWISITWRNVCICMMLTRIGMCLCRWSQVLIGCCSAWISGRSGTGKRWAKTWWWLLDCCDLWTSTLTQVVFGQLAASGICSWVSVIAVSQADIYIYQEDGARRAHRACDTYQYCCKVFLISGEQRQWR